MAAAPSVHSSYLLFTRRPRCTHRRYRRLRSVADVEIVGGGTIDYSWSGRLRGKSGVLLHSREHKMGASEWETVAAGECEGADVSSAFFAELTLDFRFSSM